MDTSGMMIDNDTNYLNHAAIGPMPNKAYNLFDSHMRATAERGEAGLDIQDLEKTWDLLRENFGKVIGGPKEGVLTTLNTASGLQLAAEGFSHRFESGKNIVINDLEFTTNSYLWQKLCSREKMELRVASFTREDGFNYAELIDRNTEIVSISSVQFSNGYRADLADLSKLARENDSIFVVDAIQSLGSVPFDFDSIDPDIVAAGAYKWLLGPVGNGYCFINPKRFEEFDSMLVGWFGDYKYHEMSHHEFRPWVDAREYQQILSPVFYALNSSLEQILDWGIAETFDHVKELIDHLLNRLEGTSYELDSSMDPGSRSCIVRFKHPEAEGIVKRLLKSNIVVAYRDGGIRVSPHRHNGIDQIDALASELRRLDG